MPKKLYLETVGCQMNVLDSELVVGSLRRHGYELTQIAEDADVIFFNTCSVRQHAEDKIYSALGRLRYNKNLHPDVVIGVLGCMAQKDQDLIKKRAPHVDIICGTGQLAQLPALIQSARDTGALGVKVRPNGFPAGIPHEQTIQNIALCLKELGDYAQVRGIEIWLEVHGPETQNPRVCAAIMRATEHKSVGLCWNSNPTDLVQGSVRVNFELLRPWIRNVHINELADERYPWRELFTLLGESGYDRYTLCEAQESKEPERFLHWYRALWKEMNRP